MSLAAVLPYGGHGDMGWMGWLFEKMGIQKSRVVIYARSSDPDPKALSAQVAACRNYCKKIGWIDVEEYVESLEAKDSENQPQLQRLLSEIQDGQPIHTVVVQDRRRLTSLPNRLLEIEKTIKGSAGQLVVLNEQ